MNTVDFAIVGAGPAGMAAAAIAGELGLDTILIDEQGAPGGQIYRGVERARSNSPLGQDYLAGKPLVAEMRASGIDYRPNTALWHLEPEGRLYLAGPTRSETLCARRILLATGAIERPMPIPGWTLPGVMTVGAAQILLENRRPRPCRSRRAGRARASFISVRSATGAGRSAAGDDSRYDTLRELSPRNRDLAAALAGVAAAARGSRLDPRREARRRTGPVWRARSAGDRAQRPRARSVAGRCNRRRAAAAAPGSDTEYSNQPRPAIAPPMG